MEKVEVLSDINFAALTSPVMNLNILNEIYGFHNYLFLEHFLTSILTKKVQFDYLYC